ncbi:hypothetical protein [Actinomadura pelletieri]|uniref:hypothetical protein n=1 Tax=Actinomadura pelletieri TaxID=111805 RepID=UPI0011C3DFD8|nr:hypothetical protein [Actinomadura pelletieri]
MASSRCAVRSAARLKECANSSGQPRFLCRWHAAASWRAERVEAGGAGVRAVRLDTGERIAASHVVIACDRVRAQAELLPDLADDWRLRRPRYSPSCLVMHFGLARRIPGHAHHTLRFGRAWKSTFDALAAGRPQPARRRR